MTKRFWLSGVFVVVLLLTVGAVAFAQNSVDQGAPGNQGPWPVVGGLDGGFLGSVAPYTCAGVGHKVTLVSGAAVDCPSTQLATRKYIRLCNSSENTNSIAKIRVDGTDPIIGSTTAGDALLTGDCVDYPISAAVTPRCISNGTNIAVTAFECR